MEVGNKSNKYINRDGISKSMGKIDDPNRPERQRKADRDKVKNGPNCKSVQNGVKHLLQVSYAASLGAPFLF